MEMETLRGCSLCGSSRIDSLDAANNICKCRACGYVFDNPRPAPEEIGGFYSRPAKYDSWLAEEAARDALWKRRLKKLKRVSKEGSLLDVGSGIGQFLYHARPLFAKLSGTEVSDSAIRLAQAKYGVKLIKGGPEEVEAGGEGPFDNVTMFHVLEHVPNPKETIQVCRRLLRNGGVLAVAVPNDVLSASRRLRTGMKRLLRRLGFRRFRETGRLGLRKISLDGSLDEIHLSHFTPFVLKRLLEDSGFRVVESSLDPYYVACGVKLLRCRCCYAFAALVQLVLGRNIYETIWMVGEKAGTKQEIVGGSAMGGNANAPCEGV